MNVDTGEFRALAAEVDHIRTMVDRLSIAVAVEAAERAVTGARAGQAREQARKSRPRRPNPAGLRVAPGGDR